MKPFLNGIYAACFATILLSSCDKTVIKCPGDPLCHGGVVGPQKEKLVLDYPTTSYPGSQVLVTINYMDMGGEQTADIKWLADDYPMPQTVKKTETVTPSNRGSFQFTFPSMLPGSDYYVKCIVVPLNGSSSFEKIISIHYPN